MGVFAPQITQAHDQFQLHWHSTLYYNDSSGNLIVKRFTDKDIVEIVAQKLGVSPQGLVFVYRVDAFDTAVVDRATGGGQVNVDYLQLPDVTFTNNLMIQVSSPAENVRQADIVDEYHSSAIGTISGVEHQRFNPDGTLRQEIFHGTFHLAYPPGEPTGGFPYGVYRGAFATGKRIIDTTGAGS